MTSLLLCSEIGSASNRGIKCKPTSHTIFLTGSVSMATIEKYPHNPYQARPDFVYRVSRKLVRSCQMPMLILPANSAAHAHQAAVAVALMAPNAEVTVYPWKDPPELRARTVSRVRAFLKEHLPMTAAR